MKRFLPLLALCALALPASAAWTYVANANGRVSVGSNDKYYDGYITDGSTWSIYVLQKDDGAWQIGCGKPNGTEGGRYDKYGSARAGTELNTGTGVGSGVLDLSTLPTDLPSMNFTSVAPRAFQSHDAVTEIRLPSTITFIGTGAFSTCSKLTSFDLSNTQLARIDDTAVNSGNEWSRGAFQNCTALEKIVLPPTLEYVGSFAFTWLKSGSVPQIHFQGNVPTFNGKVFNGNKNSQWAFYVNALRYPNWKNAFATGTYSAGAVFPHYDGEKTSWLPSYLNDSSIYGDPSIFFGYVKGVPPFVETSERAYLIQEGDAGEVVPASSSVHATAIGRDSATFEVTVDLGTATSGTLTFTFNGQTRTENVTASDTTYTYTFTGLALETEYAYHASVEADSGDGETTGSVTTVGPDVKLGAATCLQPDDGLSATLTVNVASLLSGTADIVLSCGGATVDSATVSQAGDVTFTVTDLTLWQTYDYTFTATSSENGDVATATLSFRAQPYHWEYTPNGGETQAYPWDGTTPPQAGASAKFNNQPYLGTLTDGRWVFCVYRDASWPAGEFWLGEGGSGSTAFTQQGLPDLDLTGVYADTGIKLVGIGGYAFSDKAGALTSIVFPKTIKHIGKSAFYKCTNLTSVDLGTTSLTNVLQMGFQNCTGLADIVFPATLQTLGGTALAWGPASRVIHFRGGVPTCEPSDSSGTKGADQALYQGNANKQWAYCVDAETYPEWRTHATTTLYDSFPSGEQGSIPASVRYGSAEGYEAPFGNSTLGRGFDTSSNGRAYLIQESAPAEELGFSIILF